MLKHIPFLALTLVVPLSAFALHVPQDTQPRPTAPPTAQPHDHAINSKGTGATNGRVGEPTPAPTPTPLDHAINSKGTGGVNGRVASPTPSPTPHDHAINTKGTGATSNGRTPQP